MKRLDKRFRRRRLPGMVLGCLLLAAAVISELRKPKANRSWEGRIAGVVPYDLRRPTLTRMRERWWNPSEPRLLVPTVFGVGWTLNFARLFRRTTTEEEFRNQPHPA
jgi:hypothetical protein